MGLMARVARMLVSRRSAHEQPASPGRSAPGRQSAPTLWATARAHVGSEARRKRLGRLTSELHAAASTVEGVLGQARDGRVPDYVRKLIEGYGMLPRIELGTLAINDRHAEAIRS